LVLGPLLVLAPAAATAQDGAECAVVECARNAPVDPSPTARGLWDLAAVAHAVKIEFADAARQFVLLQTPPAELDIPAMSQRLAAMRSSLVRWDAALQQLEKAAAPSLRSAETHLVLGSAYLDRHRLGDALRELTEASRIEAERADVHAWLAVAHAASGSGADAIREWRRATSLDPRRADYAYSLAAALRAAGRGDEAKRMLQQVVRLRSAVPVPALAANVRREQPFDRVGLFRPAAGVAPLFVTAPFLALAALEAHGASALEDLTGALALPPQPGEDRRLKGLELWVVAGDQNGAVRELREALAQRPGDERARIALAFVLRAAGRVSEAEQVLGGENDAPSGIRSYRLGQLFESQSRLADAARAYEASLDGALVLGRDALLQRLARVRVNQADFEGAINAYAERITLTPNSAEAHRSLGEIYYLQGRDEDALAEFLVAVWLDPMDARAWAALGKVQVRAQRYAEAVPALQRAVALDPGRADAHYPLGQALARTGRADDARREMAEFERLDAAEREKGQRDFRSEQSRVDAGRLLAAGDVDGATALLKRLAAEDAQNARWPREIGAALLRARRFPEAVAMLEAAQAKTATVEGERLLADAYAAAGRTAEARERQGRYDEAMRRVRLEQLTTGEL
jgi:tetratricopeptide (TPR) repeat protein